MKIVTIGYGGRGSIYTHCFCSDFGAELVAVCDVSPSRLELVASNYKNCLMFNNEDEFFSRGRLADLCIVSTQDAQHKDHAIKAMKAGYDLLLEKPIAITKADCIEILEASKKYNSNVYVCHVLRYAPFFSNIKTEIESGKYGKIVSVNLSENVGYWHYLHGYVRGSWHKSETSSPMILAKSCHDLDILNWLIDDDCKAISSFGSLSFFKEENAPEGSAERCLDCKYVDSCEFSAVRVYMNLNHKPFGYNTGNKGWPACSIVSDINEESLLEALRESNYGKCAFRAGNNVVDHQVVNILYNNGVTAHLTMTGFSRDNYRSIHVHCERGEVFGDMNENQLVCRLYNGEEKTIDLNNDQLSKLTHGGGDYNLLKDIFNIYSNPETARKLTSLEHSVNSHFMCFAAEESRLNGDTITMGEESNR